MGAGCEVLVSTEPRLFGVPRSRLGPPPKGASLVTFVGRSQAQAGLGVHVGPAERPVVPLEAGQGRREGAPEPSGALASGRDSFDHQARSAPQAARTAGSSTRRSRRCIRSTDGRTSSSPRRPAGSTIATFARSATPAASAGRPRTTTSAPRPGPRHMDWSWSTVRPGGSRSRSPCSGSGSPRHGCGPNPFRRSRRTAR